MDVSIVMINYKTPKLCIDCVESIYRHSKGFTFEIIIIDNNSQDGSLELLFQTIGDRVKIIPSDINLGTTKANNLGAREATGRYILFLNSDTILLNNYIGILKDYIEMHPDVAACVGNFYDINERPTHSYRKHFDNKYFKQDSHLLIYLLRAINKKRLSEQFNYSSRPMEVFYICCAGMLIERERFWAVGGYDEDIFMYGEEPIICNALWEKGWKCISIPDAKLMHFEGASFENNKNELKFNPKREERIIAGTRVFFIKCCQDPKAFQTYLLSISSIFKNQSIIKRAKFDKISAKYFADLSKFYKKVAENEVI